MWLCRAVGLCVDSNIRAVCKYVLADAAAQFSVAHAAVSKRPPGLSLLDYKISRVWEKIMFDSLRRESTIIGPILTDAIKLAGRARRLNMSAFKATVSQCSRVLDDEYTKISLHIYTNFTMPIKQLEPFAKCIKEQLCEIRGRNNDVAKWYQDDDDFDAFLNAFDDVQCHRNGGLALPGGVKNDIRSTIINGYLKPLINAVSSGPSLIDVVGIEDEYINAPKPVPVAVSNMGGAFFKEAIGHASVILNSNAFDFNHRIAFTGGWHITRQCSSYCSLCDHKHDNDNTLLLSIDEETQLANWTCDKLKENRKHL